MGVEVTHAISDRARAYKEEKDVAIKHLESCQKGHDDCRKEMLGISEDIHPFSLNDNQIKPASQVENELENRAVQRQL